jgi:hypothetical protein
MKIIKNLIKINPETVLSDEQVLQIIKLRVNDVSSCTRESALDII